MVDRGEDEKKGLGGEASDICMEPVEMEGIQDMTNNIPSDVE